MSFPKFFLIPLICYSCISIVNSQTTYIIGKVTKQSSRSEPLYPVQIIAENSNPSITQSNGIFKLFFKNLLPGDDIGLKCTYKDWVVVNNEALFTRLPKNPISDTIDIYMSSQKDLDSIKAFYLNEIVDKATKKYKSALLQVKKAKNSDSLRFANILNNYDTLLNYASSLADRLSRINLDAISELEKSAIKNLQNGDVDSALIILEKHNSKDIILQAKQNKFNLEKTKSLINNDILSEDLTVKEEIEKLMLQGDLYYITLKWDSAKICYQEAVTSDSANTSNISHYSNFLAQKNDISESIVWNKILLARASTGYDKMLALFNLLKDYSLLSKVDSIIFYGQSLEVIIKGFKDEEITNQDLLVNIGNALGITALHEKKSIQLNIFLMLLYLIHRYSI